MTTPHSPSTSFVAGVNPRLSSSGSIPVFLGTPPTSVSPVAQHNFSTSNNPGLVSTGAPTPNQTEALLLLQQQQLQAQQAALAQQEAMIRQQQELMLLRQQELEMERAKLLVAHQQQSSLQQGALLMQQQQAALLQQQQQAALLQQQQQSAALLAQQQAATAQTQPSNGFISIHHPQPDHHESTGHLEDETAPTSYFGNDGMDDVEPPPPEELEVPPPPPEDSIGTALPQGVHRLSLSALSDSKVGALSATSAEFAAMRGLSLSSPGVNVGYQTPPGSPFSSQSSSSTPFFSPMTPHGVGGTVPYPSSAASTAPIPMLGNATQLGSSTGSLSSSDAGSYPTLSTSLPSSFMATAMASSSSPAGTRSPLSASTGDIRDEEGGLIRPDDLTQFVPIVPVKKDYSAQNAIKDKAIDDLVFFSRNFQIIIKGGTLLKLIERLTFESTTDNDYIDTFLLTYRTFISPTELLEQLLDRYKTGMAEINPEGVSEIEASNAEKKQKIIRIRVGNVLKRWLTDHYHDYHDPQLLSRLESGIAEIQEQQLQGTLKKTIQEQQLQKNKIRDLMFSKEKPMPILPKGQTFDDWDVIEVARQLCLYEQTIYQSIHPKEALNQAWNKHKERAPNIIKMISFFNRISKWVSTQICHREDYKARVKLIMKFMMLTMQLRQYNNFDCMQAVLSGLNNSSVFRMKASWAKIQKDKLYSQWKQMADHITDTTNNSHNYRAAVTHADPPIIPYLGVYLTDLTFTEDGNSDYLRVQGGREDIINFEKMRRVAVVIKDICTYQQTPYNFERVPLIYDFFAGDLQYEDDNALFKRSRALEPPDTNNPGQVITPKKAKKSLSFRRVSLGVFSSKDKDSDGDSSPKGSPKSKDKKDKDKKK